MVKPISPYLQRPLRSLEEALRDLERARAEADAESRAKAAAVPDQPAPSAGTGAPPQDCVTIGGQTVAVAPGEPVTPPTSSQLDVTA